MGGALRPPVGPVSPRARGRPPVRVVRRAGRRSQGVGDVRGWGEAVVRAGRADGRVVAHWPEAVVQVTVVVEVRSAAKQVRHLRSFALLQLQSCRKQQQRNVSIITLSTFISTEMAQ